MAKRTDNHWEFFFEDSYGSETNLVGLDANRIVYSTGQAGYSYLEKKQTSPHRRRCINGQITGCGKCVGYCTFCEHPGYLTKELRKEHNCIKKNCHYYQAKEKTADNTVFVAAALSKHFVGLQWV